MGFGYIGLHFAAFDSKSVFGMRYTINSIIELLKELGASEQRCCIQRFISWSRYATKIAFEKKVEF